MVYDPKIDIIEETYTKQESTSIKQVVLRHVERIAQISSKELTPSYWQKKPVKIGDGVMVTETYHEDLREAYCNAVDCLLDFMFPDSDKKFTEYLKEYKKKEDKIYETLNEKNKSQDDWIIEKLRLRKELFREINILFYRINFFEGEEYSE